MAKGLQSVRGTRDILGQEQKSHNYIVNKARSISELYNFSEITTPIFEFSEVFHRSLGETSDVVSKETYTFIDRDTSSITLRPEFTAAIVRSVISNSLVQSMPLKYFSAGPVFRHERPQKCRYRQFSQINFEILGLSEYQADVECIAIAWDILTALGLNEHVKLELSTIGDFESRSIFRDKLIEYFSQYKSSLSEDSLNRLEKNPLRILDSKDECDKRIVAGAPRILDYLNNESLERFESIKSALEKLGIPFTINPTIVRGLDYYCHTVFEFTTDKLGSQGTVLAGGRYDGLFELMGAAPTAGIGFAAGVDRLAELASENIVAHTANKPLVVLVPIGDAAKEHMLHVLKELRTANLRCDYVVHNKVGKQFEKADKMGANYTIVFGDSELQDKKFKLKNMQSGQEEALSIEQIIGSIK